MLQRLFPWHTQMMRRPLLLRLRSQLLNEVCQAGVA